MQNRHREIADKIRGSGAILQFGLVLCLLALVVIFVSFRDFYTSLLGYSGLPRAIHVPRTEVEAWIITLGPIAAAALPQGVTALGVHLWMLIKAESDTETVLRWLSLGIAALAAVVDVWTGYVYYLDPIAASVVPFDAAYQASAAIREAVHSALLDSAIIDTFGSEVGSSVVLGTLVVIWPDLIRELRKVLSGQPQTRPQPQPDTPPGGGRPPHRPGGR